MMLFPRATGKRLGALIGLCLLLTGPAATTFAQVTVEVETDRYVLPIAELASTQTNPDVIILSNQRLR